MHQLNSEPKSNVIIDESLNQSPQELFLLNLVGTEINPNENLLASSILLEELSRMLDSFPEDQLPSQAQLSEIREKFIEKISRIAGEQFDIITTAQCLLICAVRFPNEEYFKNVNLVFDVSWDSIPEKIRSRALILGVKTAILRPELDDLNWIIETFNPGEELDIGIINAYQKCIQQGWYEHANRIRRMFSSSIKLPQIDITMMKEGLITQLKYGIGSPDMADLAKYCQVDKAEIVQYLIDRAKTSPADWAIDKFISIFNLDSEQMDSMYFDSVFDEARTNLETLASFQQLSRNIQLRLLVMENQERGLAFELLKSSPYLVAATKRNPSMASELISGLRMAKSPDLQNLKEIFRIHDLSSQESDRSSNQIIYEELHRFKRNSEIIQAMRNHGINTDAWLNYSKTTQFTLEKEETDFLNSLNNPIRRIISTAHHFAEITHHALEPIRTNLSLAVINKEKESLENQLSFVSSQLEVISPQVDSDKYNQLLRSKQNIESRIARLKQTTIYQEITNLYTQLLKVFLELQQRFETDLNKPITQQGEFIKYFKERREQLEARLLSFRERLHELLMPAIRDERMQTIISLLTSQLDERSFQIKKDFASINTILKLETNQNSPLLGRNLTIKIWDRNPHIDLYLGNYTNCCIRIESGIHEGEIPIADYITDLGIQVIEVFDDETNLPIVAAWCFAGEDENEVKFIIDNIEANTTYSDPFKKQITEELSRYVFDYAQACGFATIKQGPDNNDLIVAEFDTSTKKVGGYNKPTGYYLEAENEEE